jgi:hypothetical protein
MASIICESPRKFEDVKKRLEDYIKEQENHFAIWQKVMDVLKDYDGKIVSKKMESAVKKILPDYTIYLENDDLIIFHIWGKEIGNHEKRINIYLRKGKEALNPSAYSHSITLENSGYFPYIPERNEKLKAFLANDGKMLKIMVKEWNRALIIMQNLNEQSENWGWPLSSIFDNQSR